MRIATEEIRLFVLQDTESYYSPRKEGERTIRKKKDSVACQVKWLREEGESEDLVSGVACQTGESMADLEAQAKV